MKEEVCQCASDVIYASNFMEHLKWTLLNAEERGGSDMKDIDKAITSVKKILHEVNLSCEVKAVEEATPLLEEIDELIRQDMLKGAATSADNMRLEFENQFHDCADN